MTDPSAPARMDSQALAAVTTGIVRLHAEHFGKGPVRARTERVGTDGIVCVLRDNFTSVEHTLIDRGEQAAVQNLRRSFQDVMAADFSAVVEYHTNRRVRAYMSQVHIDPDISTEIFFLDMDDSDRKSGPTG